MKRLLAMVATGCAASSLILMGGVAPALAGTGSPAPVTKIVYADLNGGIWIVKADATGRHEISTATANGVSFSPDGKQIAYTAVGGVWSVPVTGGAPRHLTPGNPSVLDVAWSPNGKSIAYTAQGDSQTDIYRIPANGGSPQRLTFGANSDCADSSPAWSPDSTTIAYIRQSGGSACAGAGLVVQRIGRTGETVVPGFARSPSFTPAGNLVYFGLCDVEDECGSDVVSYEANVDGSAPVIIDHVDDCRDGDLCQDSIIGAARDHGWVEEVSSRADDPRDETCFQGGYQKAGTLLDMAPTFCLTDVPLVDFDVV